MFPTLRRASRASRPVIVSLALGIDASKAIFSLIDAVMLRTMSVHEPRAVPTGSQGRLPAILVDGPVSQGQIHRDAEVFTNPNSRFVIP